MSTATLNQKPTLAVDVRPLPDTATTPIGTGSRLSPEAKAAIGDKAPSRLPRQRVSGKTPVPNVASGDKSLAQALACVKRAFAESGTDTGGLKGNSFTLAIGYWAGSLGVDRKDIGPANMKVLREASKLAIGERLESFHAGGRDLSQRATPSFEGRGEAREVIERRASSTKHDAKNEAQRKEWAKTLHANKAEALARLCRQDEPQDAEQASGMRARAVKLRDDCRHAAKLGEFKTTARLTGWIATANDKLAKEAKAKAREAAKALKAQSARRKAKAKLAATE